jgi:4-amino-4-deoxychorismate lyase
MYFESIRCIDGVAKNLFFHQKRIIDTICIELPLQEYIFPPTNQLLKAKLIYDKSGILEVSYSPYQKRNISTLKLIQSDIKYDKKYLNRDELNNLFEKKGDADDILIFDSQGYLKDTSIANIALLIDGIWYSPQEPLLKGTMREKLLFNNQIKLKKLKVDDLKKAKGFALLNSMIGFDIIRVKVIDR